MIIGAVEHFVKEKLNGSEGGHDWFHTDRVRNLALKIAAGEGGDLQVIELAALLHDIADPKFHNGDENLALNISGEFLAKQNVDAETIDKVLFVIQYISFKNRKEAPEDLPLELKIIQDADRLDAIGAIGVARVFSFAGYKNNVLYDPEIAPQSLFDKENYKKSNGTAINHFYEKLLLLKDLMNTETARKLAAPRHAFLETYLQQFFAEWHEH